MGYNDYRSVVKAAVKCYADFLVRTTLEIDSSDWSEIWRAAYRILEQAIVPQQLKAWVEPLHFVKTEPTPNGSVRVHFLAPNDFSAQWIRDQYQAIIEDAFTQITGSPCELAIAVLDASESNEQPFRPPVVEQRQTVSGLGMQISGDSTPREARAKSQVVGLDPRYTFENFVVGASNQFGHASAVAVAEQPAGQYNPLFIYSPPGLGKTHLLHAIGNHVLQQTPSARVAYLSAESFTNDLIESIQHNRMSAFRGKYRDSFDMLLIDDIQFIAGKTKTEEEFFHTFNALHSSKRQIVVTSDRPPKEIEGLAERIRTRFEWGLVADLHPPEIETRIAILKAKAERDDIYLPDDVATFIATYVKTNVRELEGLLIRLQAQASLTGAEISLDMAKHELKIAIPEEGSHFTIESIQNAVAKHYRIRVLDLKSSARARSVSLPRQIAMFLIRKYTGVGYKEIGQYFGGKDHSTILHACNKIEDNLETDHELREAVESIQNLL